MTITIDAFPLVLEFIDYFRRQDGKEQEPTQRTCKTRISEISVCAGQGKWTKTPGKPIPNQAQHWGWSIGPTRKQPEKLYQDGLRQGVRRPNGSADPRPPPLAPNQRDLPPYRVCYVDSRCYRVYPLRNRRSTLYMEGEHRLSTHTISIPLTLSSSPSTCISSLGAGVELQKNKKRKDLQEFLV
jgi:hypothetical protein